MIEHFFVYFFFKIDLLLYTKYCYSKISITLILILQVSQTIVLIYMITITIFNF